MKNIKTSLVACGVLWATSAVHAVEVEIPGLLTDRTVSSIGHDFYREFSHKWESSFTGNLSINEKPSARWGSWITVTLEQEILFQLFLFPTKRGFEQNVDIALAQTQAALQRRQIDNVLLSTGDLTRDEF